MKNEAKIQLDQISISDIKSALILKDKVFADSISISDNETIKREDIYNINYQTKVVKRNLIKISVPLNDLQATEFKNNFNAEKLSEDRLLVDQDLINSLKSAEGASTEIISNEPNRLIFPLEISNGNFSPVQRPNFIKSISSVETCYTCEGKKKVTCDDIECNGQHIYTCNGCEGKGKIGCTNCGETGKTTCTNCNGSSQVKCGSFVGSKVLQFNSRTKGCNGSGKVTVTQNDKKKSINCPSCRGKGSVRCEGCSRGNVVCSRCDGAKKITCSKCSGAKKIECSYCDLSGKINCKTCYGNGQLATLYFVQTEIIDTSGNKSIGRGDSFTYDESLLNDALSQEIALKPTFDELDNTINTKDDELASEILEDFRIDTLDPSQTKYPRLLQEKLSYNVIPVVKINYTHLLTKSVNEVILVDIKRDVKIQKLGDPEKTEVSVASAGKSVKGFFGKVFKTKKHGEKLDKLNQIKLMIYLAKADGVMDENEKSFLADHINDLDDLTNKEKNQLFDLMSATTLPPLSSQKIEFSSKAKAKEIISLLENLAQSDGDYDESEKKVISEVKQLLSI